MYAFCTVYIVSATISYWQEGTDVTKTSCSTNKTTKQNNWCYLAVSATFTSGGSVLSGRFMTIKPDILVLYTTATSNLVVGCTWAMRDGMNRLNRNVWTGKKHINSYNKCET